MTQPHDTPPPASPHDCEIDVDRSAFDNLAEEIGIEGAQQSFAIFISETDDRFKRFRQLSCDNDRTEIKNEAHGLKGTAGNFGLRKVSDLAKQLEQDAGKITAGDFEIVLRNLETSYAAARERFAHLVA